MPANNGCTWKKACSVTLENITREMGRTSHPQHAHVTMQQLAKSPLIQPGAKKVVTVWTWIKQKPWLIPAWREFFESKGLVPGAHFEKITSAVLYSRFSPPSDEGNVEHGHERKPQS